MNILLIEDRGSVSSPLTGLLQNLGHKVFDAGTPADADDHWDRRKDSPIHCIIADLNMSNDGLTPDEAETTRTGRLTAPTNSTAYQAGSSKIV